MQLVLRIYCNCLFSYFRRTGIGMHAEVKDPDDKIVLSRIYSAEG